eukprot:TRINITY_DN4418_c0_g1_i1.p1 TRINITY_DN4418_c0_g1~~TRINITY_DN4418_c0_g1_i1.p1  ORF type:complete len:82 (+),score=11.52 TRINITY_DN4418_c0_g1_i1:156-401(+)
MFYSVGHGFNDFIQEREESPYNPYDLELTGGIRPPHHLHACKDSDFPEQNFGDYLFFYKEELGFHSFEMEREESPLFRTTT